MNTLDRGQVPIGTDEKRVYVDLSTETMGLSVSEINEWRDTPEKDEAIDGWQSHFDGTAPYKTPHYKEQGLYKRKRGTLGHYVILSQLGDVPKSDEEHEAEHVLKNWSDERPAATEDDVPWTHIDDPHAYDGSQPWSQCMRDINWATNNFEDIASVYEISPNTTIDTETYIINDTPNEPLYGGQFDLLYSPQNVPTTLCDLKFSSGIRYGNKLQLAAYRNALLADERFPDEIPRLQVIRLYPDKEELEVGVSDSFDDDPNEEDVPFDINVWDEDINSLTEQFLDLAESANDEWLTQTTWDEVVEAIDADTDLGESV